MSKSNITPCFEACPDCGTHGTILFSNGTRSVDLNNKADALVVLSDALENNMVSVEDFHRITKQIMKSNLSGHQKDFPIAVWEEFLIPELPHNPSMN